MTRYADPERCPDCLAPMAYGASRCPSCGLLLEGPLAAQLFSTLSTADQILLAMRTGAHVAARSSSATTHGDHPVPVAAGAPAGASAGATGNPAVRAAPSKPRRSRAGVGATSTTVAGTAGSPVDAAGGPSAGLVGGPPAGSPPPGAQEHPGGLSGASVPKILLGLGALCLLVAALVFLAVSWSRMGLAARTATLLGFTVVAAGLATWAGRRDLRAAVESLGVVALGLLTFDLVGARNAGWLGDISLAGFAVILGVVLTAAGGGAAILARRAPVASFVGGEVFGVLGVGCTSVGLFAVESVVWYVIEPLAVVLAAVVALVGRVARLRILSVAAVVVSVGTWLVFAAEALSQALDHPSLEQLWLQLQVGPILLAAALALAPAFARRLPTGVRVAGVSVAVMLVVVAVLAPVTDESATQALATAATLLVVVAALTWVAPQPWRRGVAVPVGLGLLCLSATALVVAFGPLLRIADAGGALWAGSAGDSFGARSATLDPFEPWLLPVLVVAVTAALVAVARSFSWADQMVAPLLDLYVILAVTAATGALTLASYPVPIWLVAAVLVGVGVAFVAASLRRAEALPLALSSLFLALGLILCLHAEWLTLLGLVPCLVTAVAVHLRWPSLEIVVVAGALVAVVTAGLVWTIGALAGLSAPWTAAAALLVLAALVLGGPYVDERIRVSGPATYARLGTELGALVTAGFVSVAGVDLAAPASTLTWQAVYLTLVGAAVSAMALLRADRRLVGWLGGFLLAAASWVRLADVGVDTVEAYTLPSAIALVLVGLAHLRRNPQAGTVGPLTPGLGLALVPSLLWALADPISLRSVLLGVGCLTLLAAGVALRWSAPVLFGAVVGAVLVLRLATPVAEALPRWVLIGAAGVLLVAVGITWEQRVRDARKVAGYVRALR